MMDIGPLGVLKTGFDHARETLYMIFYSKQVFRIIKQSLGCRTFASFAVWMENVGMKA